MSTNREDFGTTFTIHTGTTKTLELTILDPDTGLAKSLSDTNVYATGVVKIYQPDGTLLGSSMNVTFTDRANGVITFTVSGTDQGVIANAGNWIGEVEFSNINPVKIDQQKFNVNIIESY
tara:strand:+ start:278 stop:637 length:360 start_codon:yes stop_codon:yes gene_type:complete